MKRVESFGYDEAMKIATGTVIEGKVVLEGATFPEGTVVAVIAHGDEPAVTLPPALQAELEAVIDEADHETGEPAEHFFARLKRAG